MNETDVAIIGGGPSGSAAAMNIAKEGFDVNIIEKDSHPGEFNVCAGGVDYWVVREFEAEKIVEKKIDTSRFYYPWGEDTHRFGSPVAATLKRNVFDPFLAHKAERLGTTILTQTTARKAAYCTDGIELTLETPDGNTSLRSRIVIFADGPNTLSCRELGIGFCPSQFNTAVSIEAEVRWENNHFNDYKFFIHPKISPWGYGWIFPRKDSAIIGVECLYSESSPGIGRLFERFIEYGPVKEILKGREIGSYHGGLIPLRPAKEIVGERVMVVGDAAGMVDPIFGGGISPGIRSGQYAGNQAVKALREKRFTKSFLQGYQRDFFNDPQYRRLKKLVSISDIFFYLKKYDTFAFSKLMAVQVGGGLSGIIKNWSNLFYSRKKEEQKEGQTLEHP